MNECNRCFGHHVIKRGTRNNKQRYLCKECNFQWSVDLDLVKLAKSRQGLMDKNRVANKISREAFRKDNALIEMNSSLIKKLDAIGGDYFDFKLPKDVRFKRKQDCKIGIIQLSDLHFGECVKSDMNTYDWEVAGKRLKKFVSKSREKFLESGVEKIVIAMTGDMFNSPRRTDELLTNSHNIMQSLLLGTSMISQIINDLTSRGFMVDVVSVCGNESRIDKEMGHSDILLSNNLDYCLDNMLEHLFVKDDRVNFIKGGLSEKVICINGHNILLTHGTSIQKNPEGSIQKIIAKYSIQGIKIDYILFGHIHSCLISDFFARAGSLVGSNPYADKGLNLSSRASQNMFIIGNDVEGMRVDLQNTDGIVGYDVKGDPAYINVPKEQGVTILKIVI